MPLARRPLSGYARKTTLFSPSLSPSLPSPGQITATREVPAKSPRRNGRRGHEETRRHARASRSTSPSSPPPLPEPFNGICIVCKLAVFMARMPRARTSVHWLSLFLSSRREGRGGEQGFRERGWARAQKQFHSAETTVSTIVGGTEGTKRGREKARGRERNRGMNVRARGNRVTSRQEQDNAGLSGRGRRSPA